LNIPGEDLPQVSHYFQDPHLYFRRKLVIVGGRNSAVEAAIRCHRAGGHVALVSRRENLESAGIKYWLLPEITSLMDAGKIAPHFQAVPTEIAADRVVLGRKDGERYEVEADFVLLMTGYEADMSLCKMAGVELTGSALIPAFDNQTMETNVPGVFVAGTAVGGTQERYRVFIENCHIHSARIVAALTGAAAPVDAPPAEVAQRPES
jgi:thioredoxin reductase (NADPH)